MLEDTSQPLVAMVGQRRHAYAVDRKLDVKKLRFAHDACLSLVWKHRNHSTRTGVCLELVAQAHEGGVPSRRGRRERGTRPQSEAIELPSFILYRCLPASSSADSVILYRCLSSLFFLLECHVAKMLEVGETDDVSLVVGAEVISLI